MRRIFFLAICMISLSTLALAATPEEFAASVTIHRDQWGVPHIDGPTDAAVAFGFAHTQCEDYFWQLEQTTIMGLGRLAEVEGEGGLDNDLLNREFEIVPRSKADFEKAPPEQRSMAEAFVAGVNYFLAKHPDIKPRLIEKWEPWMLSCIEKNNLMTHIYGRVGLDRGLNKKNLDVTAVEAGSNGWAIAPQRTASGNAMLFINPHQPYYGFGQFGEAHLRSGEGLNVSGSYIFGSPLILIGRNENLGWANTTNDPDVADAWIETFDDPANPLHYKYGKEYRTAESWEETVKIKTKSGMTAKNYTFRKTHHGPIVGKQDDTHYYSARIANLFEGNRLRQLLAMAKSRTLDDFLAAHKNLDFPVFNMTYADRDGNIYYLYAAAVPKRDPQFDWTRPVDGSDPRTEWQGIHPIEDLPQVMNPTSGFVQNCNSSPFTTTDDGSPFWQDYPTYMVDEKHEDRRRAKVSRMLLRQADDLTYDRLQALAFDTTMYWPLNELPRYKRLLEKLKVSNPALAAKVDPYFSHLLDWDCRNTADSTQSTLCMEWYNNLYEGFYPAETMKQNFLMNPEARFEALATAAESLQKNYGDWKVKWGDIYRHQRHANVADFIKIPFRDDQPSLPCVGVNGPAGVVYTVYYKPPIFTTKKRYALIGSSFMGVYEFGKDKVKSKTVLQYGQSGDPNSPHFFDQGKLFSEQKFKDAWFDWEDVEKNTVEKYHPGAAPQK